VGSLRHPLLLFALLLLGLPLVAASQAGSKSERTAARQTTSADASSEGEKLFQIHCGRCHQPPDDIPRAAAGTILKHMRIRASLSKEEEQLILQYVRP